MEINIFFISLIVMPDPTPLFSLWSAGLCLGKSLSLQPGSSARTWTCHLREHLCFYLIHPSQINLGAATKKKVRVIQRRCPACLPWDAWRGQVSPSKPPSLTPKAALSVKPYSTSCPTDPGWVAQVSAGRGLCQTAQNSPHIGQA